ncbi:MAG: glycosyltransferase family 4 protein [Actinomycetota bacterium]|nr:glycosyltransferase family 4 protein [Actinomycetota bacterium]
MTHTTGSHTTGSHTTGARGGDSRKVVLANPWLPPDVRRGSEVVMSELAGWLSRHGWEPELLGGALPQARSRPASRPRGEDPIEGVASRRVKAPIERSWPGGLDRDASLVPVMAREMRRVRPAVVHSFHYTDAAAARLARLPYIATCEGIPLRCSFSGKPLHRALLAMGWSGAAILVSPSRAVADHLRITFALASEVVPNGIDISRYEGLSEQRIPGMIVCAAAPEDRRKRAEVLVDAFGILGTRMPEAQLVFVAGPVSKVREEALLARLDARRRERVRFLGQVERAELLRWYARASATCLPSVNEAFGMVLVESMAAGTPVVGARHGAIPEIVTDSTGATFAPDDPSSCARALEEVLSWDDERCVAEACRARAACYDWSCVGPLVAELYTRAAP